MWMPAAVTLAKGCDCTEWTSTLHLWTSLKIGSSLIAPVCRGGWSRSEASERLFWQWWNGRDERKGFWLQSAQILHDTSDSLYSIPGHQKIPVIQLSKFKDAPDNVRSIGLKINWVFINIPEEVFRERMYEFSFAHWHKDSHFFGYKVETGLRNWPFQPMNFRPALAFWYMHFAIAECIRLVRESKITFHGGRPWSALQWGTAWKVRRKVCTFHAYMPYRPFQQGLAWKVILIKAQLEDFANH